MQLTPFHVAVPVHNLPECESFYVNVLGCGTGRRSNDWVDLNLMGHQFVLHLDSSLQPEKRVKGSNLVDGKQVPIPHYGVILTMDVWHELADRLQTQAIDFVVEPYVRFKGQAGEQATMFFYDPAGNALEFKAFKDFSNIFSR